MKEKGYCFVCKDEKDYEIFSRMETHLIKGVPVKVRIDYAICPDCGDAMDVPSLESANEKRAFDAYKKKVGLLTGEEVREIRLRKGLSAMAFAQAVGMGAKSITRYENGAVQTKEVDLLLRLIDDLSLEDFFVYAEAISGKKLLSFAPRVTFRAWRMDDFPISDNLFSNQVQVGTVSHNNARLMGRASI